MAARVDPDGYTILLTDTTFAVNPSLLPRLPYGNCPPPLWCGDHAVMVCRMVPKTLVPGARRAVSTTVRTSASP